MAKKKNFLVVARESRMVEYLVEATSFTQAENKVYEGEGEPLNFYDEEIDVRDVFEKDSDA